MKTKQQLLAVLLTSVALSLSWAGKDHDLKPITGSAELESLKKLAGTWEGIHTMGEKEVPTTVEYKVTSNGSVVMETMAPGTQHEMVTLYYDSKDGLTMVHYCSLGNQPVMDLKKSKGGVLEFRFTKKKNTINPKKETHMNGLKLTMVDDKTLKQQWSFYEAGKKDEVSEITLTRKK